MKFVVFSIPIPEELLVSTSRARFVFVLLLIALTSACTEINNITAPATTPAETVVQTATFSSFERSTVVIYEGAYAQNAFHACLPKGSTFTITTFSSSGAVSGEGYGWSEPTTSTACGATMLDYTIESILKGNYLGAADIELKFTYETTSLAKVTVPLTFKAIVVVNNGKG